MMRLAWRKVWRDVTRNKLRTALVILSIAVGIFAVGVIAHMRLLVSRDIAANLAAAAPASAVVTTGDAFDDAALDEVRRIPDVAVAEGLLTVNARFQYRADPEKWYPIQLFVLPDYEHARLNRVEPEGRFGWIPDRWPGPAAWPPPTDEMLLERTSLVRPDLGLPDAALGDSVLLEGPDGTRRTVRLAGLTLDVTRLPASFAGHPYGYVSLETFERWGGQPAYNELKLSVAGDRSDAPRVEAVANQVARRLGERGHVVSAVSVATPGEHPMARIFQAMSIILGALGAVALLLSGSLVINTVSALLGQQVRQIGVMKAVGASTGQVMAIYLSMVLASGAMALLVAVAPAALIAYSFIRFMSYFINFRLTSLDLPLPVLAIEVAVGLLVPLLAALTPIVATARVTVREALSSYGLDNVAFGSGPIDRLLEQVRALPRPLLLSLRSSFLRKTRMGLTLTTLTLGGAIFISVVSVRASLDSTLGVLLGQWQFDARVQFSRVYDLAELRREAASLSGVTEVEPWGLTRAHRLRPDGSESGEFILFGVPQPTAMLQASQISGRWLLPGDEDAIVATVDLLKDEPDVRLGDTLVLRVGRRSSTWRIVGITDSAGPGTAMYVSYPAYARALDEAGQANNVLVRAAQHDGATQARLVQALERHFDQAGYRVEATQTIDQIREGNAIYYNIIVLFLLVMAILLAIVGALGLMGTMSINALERTREIGVMRSIGAQHAAIMGIILVEGVFVGMLSWLFACLIAWPLGKLLSHLVGTQFILRSLDYVFSLEGVALWLGAVIVLSMLASFLPAWSAARLPVREALAYE
jgi:putative ABC transport system permease protein